MIGTRSRGFSLIELVIVLIIISLLTLLVTPTLSRTVRNMEIRGAAKRVAAILRSCRSDAVNKSRTYQVNFDTESNLVSVLSLEEATDKATVLKSYPFPGEIQLEQLEFGKTLGESSLPTIEFYSNGSSNGGSAVIRGKDSRGYVIEIDFLTGSAKVEDAKEK